MNIISNGLIKSALLAVLTLSCFSLSLANAMNRWGDHVSVSGGATGGTYDITPGSWTLNGVEIGQTFAGGGSISVGPGQSAKVWDFVDLPSAPNDFHYAGDTWSTPTSTTVIAAWVYWHEILPGTYLVSTFVCTFMVFCDVMVQYDYRDNPDDATLTVTLDGSDIYIGPASGFIPEEFGLEQVGERSAVVDDI